MYSKMCDVSFSESFWNQRILDPSADAIKHPQLILRRTNLSRRWAPNRRRSSATFVPVAVGVGGWLVRQSCLATKPVLSSSRSTNSPSGLSAAPVPDQKSIDVLRFVNLSANKADDHLGNAMTEQLLNLLARLTGVLCRDLALRSPSRAGPRKVFPRSRRATARGQGVGRQRARVG